MKKNKGAFTLVEIMIVIVIVAILSGLGFMGFQEYSRNARDAVRKADIKDIEKVLEVYETQKGSYPDPDNPVANSNQTGWIEGEFGSTAYSAIKTLKNIPKDPSTNTHYKYFLRNDRKRFRVSVTLENGEEIHRGNFRFLPTPEKNSQCDTTSSPRFTAGTFLGKEVCQDIQTFKYWDIKGISSTTMKWANCTNNDNCKNFPEPSWNGYKYIYPSGKTANDYPVFTYCKEKGIGWKLPTRAEFESIRTSTRQTNNGNKYTKLNISSSNYYWSSSEYRSPYFAGSITWVQNLTYYNEKYNPKTAVCIHE